MRSIKFYHRKFINKKNITVNKKVVQVICHKKNGNRVLRCPLWSVIIQMITTSDHWVCLINHEQNITTYCQ